MPHFECGGINHSPTSPRCDQAEWPVPILREHRRKVPRKTSIEEHMQKLTTLKGPNKDLQAAAMMLGDAAARVDTKLVKRTTDLAHRLLLSLKKALPAADQQLLGDSVAEVSDLWVYGQELEKTLKDICDMRFPGDQELMGEALVAIEVEQFDYALDCIKGLQKTLPKLKRELDRQTKNASRRKSAV
jgi:hypothetical protein